MRKYVNLENLLFKGFIPKKVNIAGIDFVFKTINDSELDLVILKSGLRLDSLYNHKFNINYLFLSIFMINGINILYNRESYYPEVYKTIQQYPSNLVKNIISVLNDMSEEANSCVNLVEPYSYEDISRFNWNFKKRSNLNEITGIEGTEKLSINYFQKYWTVLNHREDRRIEYEESYGLTKFLASFWDNKGIRHINSQDKAREEERQKNIENIKRGIKPEEAGGMYNPADTVEGMDEEIKKHLRGEKDFHDNAVEQYEKSLRFDMLRQLKEIKKVRDNYNKDTGFIIKEEARPITDKELAERLEKKRNSKISPIYTNVESTESGAKFLEMSNIKDDTIIEETGILSHEEYNQIMGDLGFKKRISEEEEDLDFPNLKE